MDNAVLGKRIRESRFAQKLIIEKKALRGEDGHKSFTIRITDETAEELNKLSRERNRTSHLRETSCFRMGFTSKAPEWQP